MTGGRELPRGNGGADRAEGAGAPSTKILHDAANRWRCDCCNQILPPELLESPAQFPRCLFCNWPCDRPKARP